MRDPYTAGHEKRVSELAVAIGQKLGLGSDDLRLLRLAATVHDLGKITVPAEILSKPTRLSEAEFAIIKRHSEAGWELLEPAGLPASVTDAVLQHHERLDGSGYPPGSRTRRSRVRAHHRRGRRGRGDVVAPAVPAGVGRGAGPGRDRAGPPRALRRAGADACLQLFRDEGFVFTE